MSYANFLVVCFKMRRQNQTVYHINRFFKIVKIMIRFIAEDKNDVEGNEPKTSNKN